MARRVVVVGGGISGLVTAWSLQEEGVEVTLLDASPRLGGLVATDRDAGWLVEHAAHAVLDNAPETMALLEALDLTDEIVRPRGTTLDRYVVRKDRLVRLPAKPQQIITSSLLTPAAKLRLLREPHVPPAHPDAPEESVGQFARRRFGPDAAFAVDAFVTGVYGGDPERLSLQHAFPRLAQMEQVHGSVLKALRSGQRGQARPRLTSLRGGMQRLVDALTRALGGAARADSRVTTVAKGPDGWTVETEDATREADAVVLALPPNAARDVLGEADWPRAPVAPMTIVGLGFKAADAPGATGFGYLAPEEEKRFALGALFESNLFPERAPPGHVLVRALVGGRRHADRAGLEDAALVTSVREDLDALRVTADAPEPVFTRVVRPGAIPQIELGHGALLQRARDLEAKYPGLAFTGAGWRTVAVNGLVEEARAVAKRAAGN